VDLIIASGRLSTSSGRNDLRTRPPVKINLR
jgi:hypothetical protein